MFASRAHFRFKYRIDLSEYSKEFITNTKDLSTNFVIFTEFITNNKVQISLFLLLCRVGSNIDFLAHNQNGE